MESIERHRLAMVSGRLIRLVAAAIAIGCIHPVNAWDLSPSGEVPDRLNR